MISTWFKKPDSKVDPAEIDRKAEASLNETSSKQPRVNAIVTYLINRKHENGFGDDFEFVLLNPRGK